jgi:sporulation protein YlmC with PRC-barrel domain
MTGRLIAATAFFAFSAFMPAAYAENDLKVTGPFLKALPTESLLVSNIYSETIYDPNEKKVGKIEDMVLDKSGRVNAAILSVGGFLGVGDKDVAVPFDAIKVTEKNNKIWLTIDATKDALKAAPSVGFDKVHGIWIVKE